MMLCRVEALAAAPAVFFRATRPNVIVMVCIVPQNKQHTLACSFFLCASIAEIKLFHNISEKSEKKRRYVYHDQVSGFLFRQCVCDIQSLRLQFDELLSESREKEGKYENISKLWNAQTCLPTFVAKIP